MIYSVPSTWYNGLYQDTSEPRSSGRSFSLTHNFYRALLVVHGYGGYPGEMVSIAELMYTSFFDVYVPRLPGMGTSGKDFRSSSLSDWLGLVENAITELSVEYEEVYAFGHSMGCDLIALADNNRLKRAVLAAPAIRMKHPVNKAELRKLRKAGTVLDIPWESDPGYHLHYPDAPCDDGYYGSEYWSKLYPTQLLDLYEAMDKASPLFNDNDRYLVLYGDKDPLCSYSPRVLEHIKNKKLIKGATHYMVYDKSEKAELEMLREAHSFLDLPRSYSSGLPQQA